MTEKFSLDRFEEIIECYLLPGILVILALIMFFDVYGGTRIFAEFAKNISLAEGLVFFIFSLIGGMILDSSRHLLFERTGFLKLFGIPTIPRLEYFIDQSEIKISETNYKLYNYFTRGSYYYSEFCGNIALVFGSFPFILEKFIKIYKPAIDNNLILTVKVISIILAISLFIHYILSLRSYVAVIKKLKNK